MKMNFYLDSYTYGAIHFKPVLPASLAKWAIPGSRPYSAEGTFGRILLQQINVGSARLFYSHCFIEKDLALDFKFDGPSWLTHIALKNDNRFDMAGTGPVYMKQGQFNMIRSSSAKGTFYWEQENEYQALSIYYPPGQLQELLPYFPSLDTIINKKGSGKPVLLFKDHHWINSAIMDITDHLLHCPYRGTLRQIYFDYKIKELLLLLLNQVYAGSMVPKGLNDHTIGLINEAKYMIEAGFGQSITLDKIAKRLGMSELKLQKGLRQLFGMGLFEYMT